MAHRGKVDSTNRYTAEVRISGQTQDRPIMPASMRILFICALAAPRGFAAEGRPYPADAGQLIVTDYGAVPDDTLDDTDAFQKAIDDNWTFCGGHENSYRMLYLPRGTYILSDEIYWMRRLWLQGENREETVIQLKDSCRGFQYEGNPRPVLHCRYTGRWWVVDGWNNASFANYIEDITVNTGTGNPGAIGIMYSNHNSGAMRRSLL